MVKADALAASPSTSTRAAMMVINRFIPKPPQDSSLAKGLSKGDAKKKLQR